MKVLTIVGARPQFIKAAVVSRELRRRGDAVKEVIVHTGQHFDLNMSDIFFQEMRIPKPDYQLELGGLSHGAMTGRMLEQIEQVLQAENPDQVLVFGDTNSTMAGALAAAKLHVPVAHVEAGLRSFNRAMPEEINRVVADHVSDVLFAPTDIAEANLKAEGIAPQKIVRTGDVRLDAFQFYSALIADKPLPAGVDPSTPYVLATVHRAENTDDPARLRAILDALLAVAKQVPLVFPIHPRTRKAIEQLGRQEHIAAQLRLLPPVGYLDMLNLERHAAVIATDSGGVQKEAYFSGVPCVTLRTETEWVELVECGANTLVSPDDSQAMAQTICKRVGQRVAAGSLYGDGRAGARIVDYLLASAK